MMRLRTNGPTAVDLPRYYFFYTPPEMFQRENEIELERELRTEGDPNQPPPRKPGDRYIVGGAIVGVVVGGVGGGLLAWACPSVPAVAVVLGGIVAGALLGLLVGDRLKKRALSAPRIPEESVDGRR